MTDRDYHRRLAAIFSADVVGYSRLMGDDEAQTVETLTAYRGLMKDIIADNGGRVQDAVGDNLLAEFHSVVEAVEAARDIQARIKKENANLPQQRRMKFRIGINLGDVIEKDGVLYGDGVNIAARLEGLAEPGGICISGTAHDQIIGKLDLAFESLGRKQVKNIGHPVRVYSALMSPGDREREETAAAEEIGLSLWQGRGKPGLWMIIFLVLVVASLIGGWLFYPPGSKHQAIKESRVQHQAADLGKMAFPLPTKPSIAVLPFDNLSKDKSQDYIADGLTENIITALADIPELFVTARNSTFVYRGKAVKVPQVAEELGVRYILEGSVQKSGQNLRITAQLIDAGTGYHIWADRYDRQVKDLFKVQDEITLDIVRALSVKLTEGEEALRRHKTENLEAWSRMVKGAGQFELFTQEGNHRARELFKQAVALDPNYAFAWTALAWTYVIDAQAGFSHSPQESIKQAIQYAKKAGSLDSDQADLHSLWSIIYLQQKQYQMAIDEGQRAAAIGPNNPLSHILLAFVQLYTGNFEDAVHNAEKAVRLAPHCPVWYLPILGHALRQNGQYNQALAVFKKTLEQAEDHRNQRVDALIGLIDVSTQLGRTKQAREYKDRLLKIFPNFSTTIAAKFYHYKNPADLNRILDNLKKAGLN